MPIKIPTPITKAIMDGTLLNRRISLNNRSRSNLIWYLAGQELAVFQVARKGAALDDDLAAQHREGRPGGEVTAFPGAVIGFVQFGGAHGVAAARVEEHDIGVRTYGQGAFARVEAHDLGGVGRDEADEVGEA